MAQKPVIVWVCDLCGFEQESPSKRKTPKKWIVIHILQDNKMAHSLDCCPQCSINLAALINNTGKVQ
jgi:hypothetical protein